MLTKAECIDASVRWIESNPTIAMVYAVLALSAPERQSRATYQAAISDTPPVSREEMTVMAGQVACPRCGVAAGIPCENLTSRREGVKISTRWPHEDRWHAYLQLADSEPDRRE